MSTGTKVILAVILVPLVVSFVWAVVRDSVVTIPSGRLGLLVVKGRPTDTVLLPGPHWVPALRKRSAIEYPSVELSYRAGGGGASAVSPSEAHGPALTLNLGDRADATIGYTVRFRVDPTRLREVHDRFGPDGIWAVVRDDSARAVTAALGDPATTIDTLFGLERATLEERVGAAVAEVLAEDGLTMTQFVLGQVDLGRSGELIQAVARARLEMEREEAEAAMRLARVRHDAELAPYLSGIGDSALRYRQTDVWRDLAQRSDTFTVAVPGPAGTLARQEEDAAVAPQAAPPGSAAHPSPAEPERTAP